MSHLENVGDIDVAILVSVLSGFRRSPGDSMRKHPSLILKVPCGHSLLTAGATMGARPPAQAGMDP